MPDQITENAQSESFHNDFPDTQKMSLMKSRLWLIFVVPGMFVLTILLGLSRIFEELRLMSRVIVYGWRNGVSIGRSELDFTWIRRDRSDHE